ncbi:MAG: hypothetical protein ACHQ1D_05055 [Nitrososphaerales archaeon]|jgi:hypothetical protein
MVIKLKSRKNKLQAPPPIIPDFTIKDIDWLFSQNKNWDKFYKENESKLWESNIAVYKWCVFPLHLKEDKFYRCVLHPQVEVNVGPDKKPILQFFRNIHYAEFISHCIYYKPEEHKQYIIEKLFGSHYDINNRN